MKQVVQTQNWLRYHSLVHGFTAKRLGNLSVRTGNREDVMRRRNQLAAKLDFDWSNAMFLPLTHSNNVLLIENSDSLVVEESRAYRSGGKIVETKKRVDTVHNNPEWQAGIDGVIVKTPNLFPVMLTADCAGTAFYHPSSGVCGISHIGLVGAINNIAKKMVYGLEEYCGCDPSRIEVVLYPSIRACHYNLSCSGVWISIRDDVQSYYGKQFCGDGMFDLQGIIKWQLLESGIREENIFDTSLCTICHYKDFFSNLRAKTPARKKREGRFASIIGIRKT